MLQALISEGVRENPMKLLVIAACLGVAFLAGVRAAEIKVLSAGAVEPGLARTAEAYKRATGTRSASSSTPRRSS
jgi:ABC-type molybdate transport system substrate-binding protein